MERETLKKFGGFLGLFMLIASSVFILPINSIDYDSDGITFDINMLSATATSTTKILTVGLYDGDDNSILSPDYTATGQNRTVDTGDEIEYIEVTYLLDDAYASTSEEALDNTRIHITLSDPDSTVQYNGYIYDGCTGNTYSQATDSGDFWACFLAVTLPDAPYELTVGTWNIDIRYEIYV